MNKQELLKNTQKILEEEGLKMKDLTHDELLNDFILPGLKNSKDVLNSIYVFNSRPRKGILGKLKTLVQNKIIFTTINVIEKQSQKQQKFNELTYRAIELLIQENEDLKKQLAINKSS